MSGCVLTFPWLRHNRAASIAWFSGSGFIHSPHSEFIVGILIQVRHRGCVSIPGDFRSPRPLATLRSFLDNIGRNWSATIVKWWSPLKVHAVRVPVCNFRCSRLSGFIKRILGHDGVLCLQWCTLTFTIDSRNSELVLVTRFQITDDCLAVIRFSTGYPSASVFVHFLDGIVLNWLTSIVRWWFPVKCASFFVHIGHGQRSFGGTGHIQNGKLQFGFILSGCVLGING